MTARVVKLLAAVLLAGGLSACASTVAPKAEYVAAGVSAPVVQGRAVIVMDDAARNQTVKQNPTSLTGAATSITVPVGPTIATVGEKIFDAGFSGGSTVAAKPEAGATNVAVRLDSFSYMYDQLSNLGFAITPKVSVAITADATGPDGKSLVKKSYERKDFTTGTYVASLQPPEKINQSLHLALAEIFRELLDEIAKQHRP